MKFLAFRRPDSKKNESRLPHMVSYILEELPICMTGLNYNGIKFETLLYPTTMVHKSQGLAQLVLELQTLPEFSTLRAEIFSSVQTKASLGSVILPMTFPDGPEVCKENIKRRFG